MNTVLQCVLRSANYSNCCNTCIRSCMLPPPSGIVKYFQNPYAHGYTLLHGGSGGITGLNKLCHLPEDGLRYQQGVKWPLTPTVVM